MLDLSSSRWAELTQAYGSAANLPALLDAALRDDRPGNDPDSVWFELWSALCHQGDVYVASYAALPHLVRIAETRLPEYGTDSLLLAGSIELSRLDGRGPALPVDLETDYKRALHQGAKLARQAADAVVDDIAWRALTGSAAAMEGDRAQASALLDTDN